MPDFPFNSQRSSISYSVVPDIVRTRFDSKRSRQRAIRQNRNDIYSISLELTTDEFGQFESFIKDDLSNGQELITNYEITHYAEQFEDCYLVGGRYSATYSHHENTWNVDYQIKVINKSLDIHQAVYDAVEDAGGFDQASSVLALIAGDLQVLDQEINDDEPWVNASMVNAGDLGGELVALVSMSQTWDQYATAHSTFQARIDSGYSYYLQPGIGSASIQKDYDLGQFYQAVKAVTVIDAVSTAGSANFSFSIGLSSDGVNFTSQSGLTAVGFNIGAGLRYVRVTINASGDQFAIGLINSISLSIFTAG